MASAGLSRWLLEWASFFIVLIPLVLSQNKAPTLTITGGSSAVSVTENRVNNGTSLMVMRCTDPENAATRAYMGPITPTNPCGSCFAIMPCEPSVKTKFCLYFNQGQGKLSYSTTPSYVTQVFCTDDVNEVSATLEIRVIDNQPPTFVKPSKLLDNFAFTDTHLKREGAEIYKTITNDEERDAVLYTMTQDPDQDILEIGYADGTIRAKKDMRLLCEDVIRTTVTIDDVNNDPGSPALINIQFKGRNVRPVWLRKEPLILLKEHPDHETPNLGREILKLSVDDPNVYKRIFKMRAEPKRGLEYYRLVKDGTAWVVKPRKRLDYEYEPLRSVKLIFGFTDGFCEAEEYSTVIQLKDVNELPKIVPSHVERTVYEGIIDIDPGWKVVDPDTDDKWTWSMLDNQIFDVDPVSGRISTRGVFDVDPNVREKIRALEVRVVDRNGMRAKATMKITIIDKNDNVPEFLNRLVTESATECTPVGRQLRMISAKDSDSRRDGNEHFIYSGDGKYITILATGHIVLKQQCTAGERESISAHVTDQGSYPGPLKGVPTTISFSCQVCPPPPPPTEGEGGGGRNWFRYWYRYYSRFRIGDFPNDMGDLSDLDGGLGTLLPWLIPALLLATLLMAMMAYVCWRACYALIPRCRRCLKRPPKPPKKKRPPQNKVVSLKPKKTEDKVEVVKLTPPEPPPPEGDPRFFGFWKETYVDRDQRHFPERDTLPINVANDRVIEETEKVEEEMEKQQILWEREQKREAFLMEVQNYEHQLSQLENPRPVPNTPPTPPKKSRFCSIS